MTKIMEGKSKLEEHTNIEKTLLLIFWTMFIVTMYIYITKGSRNVIGYALSVIIFAIPGVYFYKKYKKNKLMLKEKENIFNQIIQGSDNYVILTNLFLMGTEGKGIEIEYVILGNNGVFVVYTNERDSKDYKTILVASLDNFLGRHNVKFVEKFVVMHYIDSAYMWSKIDNYKGENLSNEKIQKIIIELRLLQK